MSRRILLLALVPALALAVLSGFDVWMEAEELTIGGLVVDLLDKALLVGAMVAIALTVLRVERVDDRQQALRDHLERLTAQGSEWRDARSGEIAALGQAIAAEFRRWGLTPAEADIAGLLLKGATMKEVALARDTTESTIRQQAQGIYRKSGLSGRVELQAYFLDSLFAEAEERRASLRAVP